ncbi:somatostatin receptor type 3 [Strongylocentrotus purpuratus]|uniref:G-protein coupled receptors family 1 profile domain-containing protein n=1 Tax=Strongylocentrotus purpuratus TaxID=7668 RepID=A0A7M7HK66_STRPU|nr:somatostatin receptor type 3 [Strongylocentrotus purpuratus]
MAIRNVTMTCNHSTLFRCFPDFVNDTVDDEALRRRLHSFEISVIVISCICLLVGVVGNALIVYIVPKKDMRSVCNVFVANLAIRDIFFLLTFGLAGIVEHAVYITSGNVLEVMPLISVYSLTVTILATSGLLVALAIDRYQSIGNPLQSRSKKSFYKAYTATALIWIVAFILPVVHLIFKTPDSKLRLVVVIVNTAVAYVIPLATICVCFVIIVIAVRQGQQVSGESDHLTRWEFKRKIRVLRMVKYIVLLFSLTWGVWWGLNIFIAYLKYKDIPITIGHEVARDVTGLMVLATSAINPFIYGLTNAYFNRHLKRILCWSCAPRSLHHTSVTRSPAEFPFSEPVQYSIVKRRFSHSNGSGLADKSDLRMSVVEIESTV